MTPWRIVTSKVYDKHVKGYKRDAVVCKKLDENKSFLPTLDHPERAGNIKSGPYKDTYGINLTKSVRLMYQVNYETHEIIFVALGDHKEVYGRD